jgi:DNA-binding transcriptional LysR family regulator
VNQYREAIMIQWRQMEIFITVVEQGNFTKAAELLGISSAAVGKQIHYVEKTAQVHLLNRLGNKVSLTSFGKEYYQKCKKIQHEMEQATLLIQSQHEELCGVLRLHTPPFIASTIVIPLLDEFMASHPNLKIELSVGDHVPNLQKDDVDILVGYDPLNIRAQDELIFCNLFTAETILVASPKYLKKFGTPMNLSDLKSHQFIQYSLVPQPLSLSVTGGETITDLKTALALGDRRMICIAAVNSLGIALTASKIVKPDLYAKKLVRVLPSLNFGETATAAFYKKTTSKQPKVQLFLAALQEFCENKIPSPSRLISLLLRVDNLLRR